MPPPLLEALFLRASPLTVGQTLGIFRTEVLRVLATMADRVQDTLGDQAERKAQEMEELLIDHANYFRSMALFCAAELCASVDLAGDAVRHLKGEAAFGLNGDECETRWQEVVEEARAESLLREGYVNEVRSAVHDAFHALPRAKQVAYWLVNSPLTDEMTPGCDWLERSQNPEDWEFMELDSALNKAERKVWAMADEEAWAGQ